LDAREEIEVADALKKSKKISSDSRLDAREVLVGADALKTEKRPPLARVLMRGRWWSWQMR